MKLFSFELIDVDGKLIEVTSSPAHNLEEAESLGRRVIAAPVQAIRVALVRIRESAREPILSICR